MAASARSSSLTQGGNGARPPQNAERIGARAEKTGTLSRTLAETARPLINVDHSWLSFASRCLGPI
jgi:hypothetical protein